MIKPQNVAAPKEKGKVTKASQILDCYAGRSETTGKDAGESFWVDVEQVRGGEGAERRGSSDHD